ncbi:hypothetical protein PtA15_17A373 [Puccinia triticina]|uniref:HECT-type E3 ubiquitin transferase n=1 Tax=Puccinia triticina TaxID=208348 RepID=A0ABY7D971_9BASI|nr:uncharacterized protein PtA15_17A373 [Puccinia triticina]WAQ92891.1 hypothetical protein PtA15_17A373 [Puccinia triticina]
MTRIKRSWKKAPETNPKVVVLIKEFSQLPDHELITALEDAIKTGWQYPRSDLMFWIPVLNRFDGYLEATIKEYDLRGPGSKKEKDSDGKEIKEIDSNRIGVQVNDFAPITKRMTLAIFGFIKLLLENCTNRKLFSSYDRLNDFLLTTDTDVLLANLRLILRSAQQWSVQHQDMNGGFGISHSRLLDLLQSWSSISGTDITGLSLVDLVQHTLSASSQSEDANMDINSAPTNPPRNAPEVTFLFYRKVDLKPTTQPAIDTKPAVDEKGKGKEVMPGPSTTSSIQPSSSSTQLAHTPTTPTPKGRSKDKSVASQTSPTQPLAPVEGLATIHVSPDTLASGRRPQDILADLIEQHQLPIDCRFKLFHRIRIAMALRNSLDVRRFAVVRLLALAIYTHTTDETTAVSKLFIYEPGLISQLSELINLEIGGDGLGGDIQAAAFYALEGISRYRGKIAEVAGAVGVSVSHGTLMQVVRKMAKELERERAACKDEFIDSLFCFLSCLQLSVYAGSLLVGAGVVPVLVDICKNSHPNQIGTVIRAVTNLDGLLYGFTSAFALFNGVDGLKVFVNRIKEEVDKAIAEHPIDVTSSSKPSELLIGMLSHSSAGLLKALFRSIQRLLTSAGTLESVRNLTETQLPQSIKLIIQNKAVFGYQIYSLAINMMSTLIHSEPTSLVILQEAGLPEALYDAIDSGIEPAFDVIAAIPSALGALCLNEVGLQQLNDRQAIPAIFSVFTSERHARILRDRDHASVVGSTIDELIRHQPSLKKTVLDSTLTFLNEIDRIGNAVNINTSQLANVQLKPCPEESSQAAIEGPSSSVAPAPAENNSQDVVMNDNPSAPAPATTLFQSATASVSKKDKEKDEKDHYANNLVLLLIDVACRLLESMLQNVAHCQDFITLGALDKLLGLLRLPSIPYDFATTPAAEAFSSTIRVVTETLPRETLTVVMKQLRSDLMEIKPFWQTLRPESEMLKMVSTTPADVDGHNHIFRRLISIQAYISFLSDICVASGYSHTRTAAGILGVFNNSEESDTVTILGALQRVVFWEHILIKAFAPKPWSDGTTPAAGLTATTAPIPSSSSGTVSIPVLPSIGDQSQISSVTTIRTNAISNTEAVSMTSAGRADSVTGKATETAGTPATESSIENAKALRSIAASISQSLNPFFSAIIKLLSSRRVTDEALKKQALYTANLLAQVLTGHLVWPGAEDPFSNFAYLTVCLNTASQLLTEERGSRSTLNSLILSPFHDSGGLQTILSLFNRYVDQTDSLSKEGNRTPAQNVLLVHLYGGLKVALDLLQTLCSSTALLESPHTVLLQSWKDLVDPPFDAPGLLISMRARILADIQRLWRADWLNTAPPNVVRGVVKILLDIIKADGEASPEPTPVGPFTTVGNLMGTTNTSLDRITGALSGGLGGVTGSSYLASYALSGGRPPAVPDEGRIASLVDMGFPRSACETALARTHNNLNLATEFLLASPVLVQHQPGANEEQTAPEASTQTADVADSSPNELVAIADEVMTTPRLGSATSPPLSPVLPIPPAERELASDNHDVPMVEASAEDSGTADPQGSTENCSFSGDDGHTTPRIPSAEVSDPASSKTSKLDEVRAQMKTALSELRDPLRAMFLKRSLILAESYDELAFDLKTAFKAFEKKSMANDNKTFDGIATLLSELESFSPSSDPSSEDSSRNNVPAISVRLRMLALLANDSSFEASLHRNANTLLRTIVALLRNATGLMKESLEVTEIPKWLASSLLIVEAILAYAKDKPASEVELTKPAAEELDENDEDDDEDEDVDNPIPDSVAFLGLPALMNEPRQTTANQTASTSAAKSTKTPELSSPAFSQPSEEDLELIFQICTNVLRCQQCGRHDFLAAIRVLLILTQKHSVAEAFLNSGVPAILLRSFSFKTESRGCLPYAAMLLRHTVESNPVKQAIMTKEITHFISSHGRVRQSDLPSFCRHLVPMAWRDWSTLMETIAATCKLVPNSAATGGSWLIALNDKKDQPTQEPNKEASNSTLKIASGETAGNEMQIDEIAPTDPEKPSDDAPWRPAVDGTMQFLMSELLKAGKDCLAPSAAADPTTSPNLPGIVRPPIFSQASQSTRMPSLDTVDIGSTGPSSSATTSNLLASALGGSTNKLEKADEHQVAAFSHACFIMSWMSELLASYNECKISFMSSHHRKGKSPAKSSTSSSLAAAADLKSKHEILNFMLCDLIPTGPLTQPNTTESQKKSAIASWAIMVLVALCHEPNAGKEPSDIVTSARSFVLTGLARAIQDAIVSEEPVDTRYGRLYALSDLTFRLLTAAPFAQRPSASPSEAPIQIAKIMLEKNYAALLSNALADVDLNFPSVQRLLNSILRPLEHLTKAVTKISRASSDRKNGDSATGPASTIEVESVPPTESSVEDEAMIPTEEDAPDLYRNSALDQATDNVFGRPRTGQQSMGISTHPLLVEDSGRPSRADAFTRSHRRMDIRSGSVDQWITAIENLLGGGAGQLIEHILGTAAYGQRPIHIDLGQGPNGPSLGGVVIDPQRGVVMPVGPQGLVGQTNQPPPASRLDRHLADRVAGQTLMPLATLPRWSEEARVFQQISSSSENPAKIQRAIFNLLSPRAKQTAKEDLQEREKLSKLASEARRMRENQAQSSQSAPAPSTDAVTSTTTREENGVLPMPVDVTGIAESLALVNASADDPNPPIPEPAATEDAEMHDGTEAANQPVQEQSNPQSMPASLPENSAMQGVDSQDDIVEVINLARQLADRIGSTAEGSNAPEPVESAEPPTATESVVAQPEAPADQATSSAESTSAAPPAGSSQRVTITINGAEVDITDTGIDPTFLEALPDDMREEVLNQHFREQRPVREELSVPVPSSISTDFLDALPPEIRAEVIRSEVADQQRRRREDLARNTTAAGSNRAPADPEIDPATFLAGLDPSLREAVLLEQDDGFISTLPPNLLAEVDALRDRVLRRQHAVRSGRARDPLTGLPVTSASPIPSAGKKVPVKVDAVQVLDRSGIAALVRLMFFPQPLRRHSLQKVLVNLCENSRSRTELISTLLGLLQDGTRDSATIDRSFSQVSSRASKALTPVTPKSTSKLRRETHVGPLPHFPGESVPNLIALRCLEALSLLVTSNDRVPIYFLTEQEVHVALHKRSAKKSKGKEKSNTSVTYPIVGLLALLDRASLLKHPNLTESITSLLALIGKPLTALAKKSEETKNQPAASTSTVSSAPLNEAGSAPAISETATSRAAARATTTTDARPAQTSADKTDAPLTTLEKAPALASHDLRMIVNVLDSGECSSKTFSHTVTFIQAISTCPNGREVIAAELLERAKFLGDALLPDLDELSEAIREAPNAAEVRSTTLAKFSSASAQQAKLLRILKTTEFLDAHAKKQEGIQLPLPEPTSPLTLSGVDVTSPTSAKSAQEAQSSGVQFKTLWEKLSECLTLVQERDDMIHIATVLLPLMESFLVVCKHAGISSLKLHRGSLSPRPEELSSDAVNGFFLNFTERHRKVLNTMVRNNPGLMSGSFSILVHNPKVLEFDNKRNYFSQQLHKARSREQYGNVQLNVRRPHVFEDSFHSLARRTGDELKYGKLSVRFYDEEGVDAGGVTREWLTILVKQMLDPNYALFTGSAADSKTYQPNRASAVNPDHLGFFTFCGRVIGKALYDGRVVDAYFTLAFYKHLLGISVGLSDLESVDPDHHRSLKWMLDNDIDGIFELTFSVEADDFGSTRIVDLKPGGQEIPVTNENKAEYVQLLVQNRLTVSIQEQIDAFKKGFDEIIPRDLVRIFSATELQLLLNGLPDINVEDWRANTELHQFQQSDSTVTWFWRAVRSFGQEERAKLLQFATGSSRVPLEGFGALQGAQGATKFSLVNAHTKNVLPSAHTCFNQIDLPSYDSYEELRRMFLIAINEGSEGFGFA